ncbi:MAG: SCP2 domain-containing protein [Methylomonas sp.]
MLGNLTPIKPLLISLLEPAINQYLSLDDNASTLLSPITGKVVAIEISSFNQTIYLCPTATKLQILETYNDTVDAKISGSLSALGLMGLSATPMRSLFQGDVRIEGDTQVAHKFQSLFAKLEINLEAKLARYTGESLAQQFGSLFRSSRDWSQQSLTSFKLNLQEFLQEETRDLPAKPEAEELFQQIDSIRSDFDRLNARIERLQNSLNSSSEPNT